MYVSLFIRKLRDPLNNPGLVASTLWSRMKQKVPYRQLNLDLAGHVHPSLAVSAPYVIDSGGYIAVVLSTRFYLAEVILLFHCSPYSSIAHLALPLLTLLFHCSPFLYGRNRHLSRD